MTDLESRVARLEHEVRQLRRGTSLGGGLDASRGEVAGPGTLAIVALAMFTVWWVVMR